MAIYHCSIKIISRGKGKSVPATDWNEQTKAEEWQAAWAQLGLYGRGYHKDHLRQKHDL